MIISLHSDSDSDGDEDSQSGDDDPKDTDYKPPASFSRKVKNIIDNLTDPEKNNAAKPSSQKKDIANNKTNAQKNKRTFDCNICHKQWSTSVQLSNHKRLHAGLSRWGSRINYKRQDGVFPCNECKKQFSSAYVLDYHMLNVHGKKAAKPLSAQFAKVAKVDNEVGKVELVYPKY